MQKKDIALLEISKIIVHDVPRHKKDDKSPQIDYSDRESNLNTISNYFLKINLLK